MLRNLFISSACTTGSTNVMWNSPPDLKIDLDRIAEASVDSGIDELTIMTGLVILKEISEYCAFMALKLGVPRDLPLISWLKNKALMIKLPQQNSSLVWTILPIRRKHMLLPIVFRQSVNLALNKLEATF